MSKRESVIIRWNRAIAVAFFGSITVGVPAALVWYFTKSELASGLIVLIGGVVIVLLAICKGLESVESTPTSKRI